MFNVTYCSIPQSAERQKDLSSARFIQTVQDEEQRVRKLRADEIQSTAENPRIREQNETAEISTCLRAQKQQQFLDQKRRQQIRENSQELRLLQVQLRSALVCKELSDQKYALEIQKEKDLLKKKEDEKKHEAERLRDLELCHAAEMEERKKKEKFRGVLLDQMGESHRRRLKDYEEVMRDRENMQKLQRQIEAEHAAELKDLERRKVMAKKEMNEFIQAQERLKLEIRAGKVDENDRFLQILSERDKEKDRIKNEKAKERKIREAMSEKIGKHLFEIESEKRRREDLLLDLLVEERKTKDDFRFRKNLEKQLDERMVIRMDLERYRQDIIRSKQERQKDEDDRLRREQTRIWAEQDRVEQMTEINRREKVQLHGRFIQAMMAENRKQRAVDAAEKLRQHELHLNNERKRQKAIEDERIRLLRKESPDVLHYLPVGVLRESDREFLALPPKKLV